MVRHGGGRAASCAQRRVDEVIARLRAHGLLAMAKRVAAEHGCGVETLNTSARDGIARELLAMGWHKSNVDRLLPVALVVARRLPGLTAGAGERFDGCVHMAECVGILAKTSKARAGHCLASCLHKQDETRDERVAYAVADRTPEGFYG